MEGTAQQSKIDTETAQAQAEQQLRQEWGRDFEGKVKQAGALAKANINPEVLDMTFIPIRSIPIINNRRYFFFNIIN